MATLQIKSGDTLSGLAAQNKTTVQELLKLNPNITNPDLIQAGASLNIPSVNITDFTPEQREAFNRANALGSGVNVTDNSQALAPASPEVTPTRTPTVSTPTPTAPTVFEQANTSLSAEVERLRGQLDTTLAKQKEDIDKRLETARAEQERIVKEDVQPLTQPFREDLEKLERERLFINENFQANQQLVGELEGLLTEGNQLIEQMKGVTGLAGIRNPRINQAIEGVNARAGVIQAVMSARNGQIAQAENMIDRSVKVITADRQDQLAYYDTLLSLENQKIVSLEKDQKNLITEQTNLIKGDLQRVESTVDYIKNLMVSPQTAQFVANAGVTLNDSVDEINTKLAEESKRREIQTLTNELTSKGYTALPVASAGSVSFEAGGKTLHFKAPPEAEEEDEQVSDVNIPDFDTFVGEFVDTEVGQELIRRENERRSQDTAGVSGGLDFFNSREEKVQFLKENHGEDLQNIYNEAVNSATQGVTVESTASQLGVTTRDLNKGLVNANMTLQEFIQLSPQEQRSFIFDSDSDGSSPGREIS